jgi:hypothetical protein
MHSVNIASTVLRITEVNVKEQCCCGGSKMLCRRCCRNKYLLLILPLLIPPANSGHGTPQG